MNKAKYNYVTQIEKKKYKTFDSIFESDEFNNISNLENRRMTFYYFALKFASLPNKNITELYNDLETILKKIKSEKFLQKYNEDVYILIINKYLEKIEIFQASIDFYENKENRSAIRDIIRCFEYFKDNNCPRQVYESLKDLYDIIIIKRNHKIPKEFLNWINRNLEKYKIILDFLNQKYNFGREKENENDKRSINIQNNNENFNEKNKIDNVINNKNNFNDKNIGKELSMFNNINKNNVDNNNNII